MKTAERGERDYLPALALVKAVLVLRLKEIIYDVLSDNEWNYVSRETNKDLIETFFFRGMFETIMSVRKRGRPRKARKLF